MAQQDIIIGAANAGGGDNYFTAFSKANSNFDELFATNIYTKRVLVNSLLDLPTEAAGTITLLANTKYTFANDVDFGSVRLIFGDRSVITGIESLVITLTYLGTGDFFTMTDTANRVDSVTIAAPNGRIFNWSSSLGLELRVTDVQCSSARFGTFSGNNSIVRFTNVSPSVTADGTEWFGSWASALWEVSGANIQAGTFFKLGTATFNSILIDKTLLTLGATATFLSGAISSGNISAGGLGTVLLTRISGTGTVLSGISTEDALWEFFHNDEIKDTRPDALLSLSGNIVPETIVTIGVPVKALGGNTWVDERSSQSTSDNTGRTTYNGGKPVVVPITMRASVEPVAGKDRLISVYAGLNGSPILNSKATASVADGKPGSITVIWQVEALPGDFAEMYISNDETIDDVLVAGGIIRVN